MDSKLYVGNLSYTTTEEGLRELFSQAGTVTAVDLIKDRDTGRSKGFAFVEMASQAEAEQAIKLFDGKSFENRDLKVNIARPREERRPSQYGDRGGSGGRSGGGGGGGYSDRNRRSGGGGGGTRRY